LLANGNSVSLGDYGLQGGGALMYISDRDIGGGANEANIFITKKRLIKPKNSLHTSPPRPPLGIMDPWAYPLVIIDRN